jgi:hypothetical protein
LLKFVSKILQHIYIADLQQHKRKLFYSKSFQVLHFCYKKKRIDSIEPIRFILRILKECILREGVLGVRRAKNRSLLERK